MPEIMTDQRQPHGGGDPLAARMDASIDNWKRKLLDLTKRNRLLNFRVTKVSTIAVVDELQEEVFRRLYIAEKSMRFKAAPARPNAEEAGNGTSERSDASLVSTDADEDALIDSHFDGVRGTGESVPYEAAAGDGRHTDEWLQTTLDPESLDRSLRRIEEQARLTVEEQGVNTLFLTLGMLQYTESADSEEVFRGPLIMLPVELSRKSARSGFELRIGDDEPMVNPALAEYLRRTGVALPDLAESDAIGDDYDLRTYFAELNKRISGKKGWSTASDIYLGLFSFQKFVMFKDLEANAGAIARHRLPRQLVGRSGNAVVGLPEDIRRIDLDEEYPPERTFQVVDADSSQLRAMAACARGYDLVIEGPPGTGKSQTITNLIAQALAANRSVLFVAEKMAALNVVHARLVAAGLGEFCLELHSSRANKRVVMGDLASTLDASLQTVVASTVAGGRLPAVRTALSEYVNALHEPYGTMRITPYAAFGALGQVRRSPPVPLTRGITDITQEAVHRTIRDLDDLAAAAQPVGTPASHPWRDTTRTLYTEADLEAVATQAGQTLKAAEELLSLAAQLQKDFGLPPIRAIGDVDAAMKVGAVLAESPGATLAVLESDAWNAPPPVATSLIELGRELSRLRSVVKGWFSAEVLEQEHRDDIAFVQEKAGGAFGFLAIFNGRFRSVRNRWKRYRLPVYSKPILAQADDLKTVDRLLERRSAIRIHDGEAQELFGALWRGEQSDWDALEAYVRWVVDFRRTCVGHGVEVQAYRIATQAAPDTSAFQRVRRAAEAYSERLAGLGRLIAWPPDHLRDVAVTEVAARVQALEDGVELGPQWAVFERCRQTVAAGVAAELLPPMLSGALEPEALSAAFRRAFYMKWLGHAVLERAPLERFASLTHEQRVTEFRDLDRRVLRENQSALIQMLRDGSQERLRTEPARAALPYLQRQIARQRNISPLRRTMKEAGAAIRAIKPCFMMSPMTVAQLLDGSAPVFDVIIFDEASQLPTEDAVGAVIRGRQLVVVGDPKQLPPTNFFSVASGQTVPSTDEDGNPLFDDSESVLEEFMGSGVPMSRLKWHYRSAHESLIRFSNVSFYDAELYTFPSIDTDTKLRGLQFEFVSAGHYEGKGLNAAEARRVADEVMRFARDQIVRQERGEAPLSLGVGTFNMRQQLAIQDELERRRREDPLVETFFTRSGAEPFFVKNLENIQGDERDVIFISVTYGPGTDGRIRYNFGPLNGENGWRRLNVLVTRARQRMRVFSSMHGEDINPAGSVSNGPSLLRDFLTFAEHGRLDGKAVTGPAEAESLFEREVLTELTNRGVRVVPQVGASGYRIDIGVLDNDVQGRFLCGIECDGVAYHSSETARDRDRLRQQVLEARGWTIHRVWSTDWFKDRKGQIERLLRMIDADRGRAHDAHRVATEVRVQLEAEAEQLGNTDELPRGNDHQRVPPGPDPYDRPLAPAYVTAGGEGQYTGGDILIASDTVLTQAVRYVVDTESPIHQDDAVARVAGMWNTRVGSRVRTCIERACERAQRNRLIRRRGNFLWNASDECVPRSRAGMRVTADRIAPEEYRAAVIAVLAAGHSFPQAMLITEVRSVLGFNRTGWQLEEAIRAVLEAMLRDGTLGEGSAGLRLRQITDSPIRRDG